MYALPLAGSVPKLTESRPLLRSALVYPANVNDAVGLPAAVACSVKPVKPVAPCPSVQARPKSCAVTPQIVAASPAWKLLTVLQMSAVAARSSTKNVSVPLPPVMKFDPVTTTDRNGIVAAAGMDEPVGRG